MKQQHPSDFLRGAFRQFFMHAVQRVAGLEGHHVLVAEGSQSLPRPCRGQADVLEIVVQGQAQHPQCARYTHPAPMGHLGHQRVFHILCAENLLGHFVVVPGVHFLDRHDRQQVVLGVAQRNLAVQFHVVRRVDGQGYRERKNVAVSQTHVIQHPLVVLLAHEPVQWRKGAGGQEFEVAHGAFGNLDRRQLAGMRLQFLLRLGRNQQVHQGAAIGRNQRGALG